MHYLNAKLSWMLFMPLVALLFAISGCTGPTGPDGNPGNAYVKVTDSDGYLYSYSDNNPSVDTPVQVDVYYLTDPGVYDFSYESRIYSAVDNTYQAADWQGTYSIHINEGDPGGPGKLFWRRGDPGADGPDSYLALSCDFGGPTYDRLNKTAPSAMPKVGDVVTSAQVIGKYRFEIQARLTANGKHEIENGK